MQIDIVTRTMNRPAFLRRARISLQKQQFADVTWIIVNDGGTKDAVDEEARLAREAGLNTKTIHLGENLGRAGAANAGIRAGNSDLFLLLDDDDRMLDSGISDLASGFANAKETDVGIVAQVWQVTEVKKSGEWKETNRQISNPERGPIKIVDLAYRNFVPVCGLLVRRRSFEAAGGFNESLPVMEDWDLLLRLIQLGDLPKIDKPVSEYFVRPELTDFSDPASNSVAGGHALHEEWEARLRNEYLRKDLATGKFGMGFLMNPQHRLAMERINVAADGIRSLGKRSWLVRQILKRVKR